MNIEHILHWFIAVAATAAVVISFSVCVAILSISTTYGYDPFKHHTALNYPLDHINLNLNSARTTPYEETTENSFRQFPLNNLIKFDKKKFDLGNLHLSQSQQEKELDWGRE